MLRQDDTWDAALRAAPGLHPEVLALGLGYLFVGESVGLAGVGVRTPPRGPCC